MINTVLFGLGTVNLGWLTILIEKRTGLLEKYQLHFNIIAVADSSGVAINAEGFDYAELIQLKKQRNKVSSLPHYQPQVSCDDIPDCVEADLLIESSPGNLTNGNPGLALSKKALQKGWSVVFANKAPLVLAFDELQHLSNMFHGSIAYSSTVCGGLPVINVLKRDLKLASLKQLRGIFNATTNYILHTLEGGWNDGRSNQRSAKNRCR